MDPATLMWGLIGLAVVAVAGALWWRRRGGTWPGSGRDEGRQPHPQETTLVEDDLAALADEAARAAQAVEDQATRQREAERAAALQAQRVAVEAQRRQAAEEAARGAERAAAEVAAREARRAAAEAQIAAEAAAIAAQAQREADEAERRRTVEAAAQEAERAAQQAAAREAQRVAAEAAVVEAQRRAALQRAADEAAAAAAEAARLAVPAPAVAPPAAPRRPEETLVMVADDSKVVRVKTSRLLAQRGYRVVLAEDGAQAAELLETELPAVLITDVEMPGMDGFALTRHVRAHPRANGIPIIMITSADDRLKSAAAEAGVTLVLGKPYPEDELIACIERSQNTAHA